MRDSLFIDTPGITTGANHGIMVNCLFGWVRCFNKRCPEQHILSKTAEGLHHGC